VRHVLRKVVIIVGSLLAIGSAGKVACPNAEASYGFTDALETIGIAAGIGTVMGLSTIAFYDTPTSHMGNALVGAGAGLLVGLGVAAYLFTTSPEDGGDLIDELLPPEKKPDDVPGNKKVPGKDPAKIDKKPKTSRYRLRTPVWASAPVLASVPVTLSHRPPEWVVAFRVLELRF
jgi:hypothetical protein